MHSTLFPRDLPELKWVEFDAKGFSKSVTGVIHRGTNPPVCGMPLGSIDTGCLDLEATGLWGYSTIFNSLMPRRAALLPFLGLSISHHVWLTTTLNLRWRENDTWLNQLTGTQYYGVRPASEIHYWGHYPVVDMEFITNAPVSVGLRAWAPFLPGDAAVSNTPGAVFEVHLRNTTDKPQKGALAFSFPGPSEGEAGTTQFMRQKVEGHFHGLAVESKQASYALGVIGAEERARFGGELGMDANAWEAIEDELPFVRNQAGASVAVDFELAEGEEKVIHFILAWYAPVWMGSGTMASGGNAYTHMYASRYKDALGVAQYLAREHESLLKRILAWQEVIYTESDIPSWLRDSLVNILHLIPETSVWAQAKPPIGKWCRPEDGLFGMNESPRWCPQIECTPDSFYANLPVVFFFPEAALSTLRGDKAYMSDEGRAKWLFGAKPYNMSPSVADRPGSSQTVLNGSCYVEMVDKMWRRTGSEEILREFYESVKRTTIFTMNLVPDLNGVGIISMPQGHHDWYEYCELPGIVPHVGGVHLAHLRMARRMAEAMADEEFVCKCDEWLKKGSKALEKYSWVGTHYLLFNDLRTNRQSDIVMAHQLDGEWIALFHGLEGVFPSERVDVVLKTLKRTSIAMTEFGAVVFCKLDGSALGDDDWDPGIWNGVHPPGVWMLAMIYMYCGECEFGLDLARSTMKEVIKRGWYWDQPGVIDGGMRPGLGWTM